MERNKRQEKMKGYSGGEQHIVMLKEPYPLIYNYETMEPAIQIGTLNVVSFESEAASLNVEAYPIIRPLLLNDEDGEINGSGIISPYSMFVGEGTEMSAWRSICLLHRIVNIEELFLLLREYCFVENTLIQDPSEIIQALKDYGYSIEMPNADEVTIYLEQDDDGVTWQSSWPIAGSLGPVHLTDMWFLAAGGGSLPANIVKMVEYAVYYDGLFLEENKKLPKYKFVSDSESDAGDLAYINETFTEWLTKERESYQK